MGKIQYSFGSNISLLRQKASRYSLIGVGIAFSSIVIATFISAYLSMGEVSIEAIVIAQKTNKVLWILDLMPFAFALWGQYMSSMLSFEASALIIDQTSELRAQTQLMEQKVAHEATHDSLTGLPNRILFLDRLEQVIHAAKRDGTMLSVFVLDMDRFKEVNDSLGHYNGDRLLKLMAARMTGIVRETDTLARIGGDEFAFIFPKIQAISSVEKIAGKVKKALSSSFSLEKLVLHIDVSVGASIYPIHGDHSDTLMQKADVAMYVAKQQSLQFVLYSPKFADHGVNRLTLMEELRVGINNDELILYFQPKVSCGTTHLYGAEALVRWMHPTHGLMNPGDFIPLAERTGLIKGLTLWVLRKAIEQCGQWQQEGLAVSMAINVFSRCFLDPEFTEALTGLLVASDLPPEKLILEITETSILVDPDRSLEVLNRITEQGVQLSIDDFGTGYSSLAYLRELPVTELKIDKSFVMGMQKSENDATIVNATIQLGHNLGLRVVAEGVEDEQTALRLEEMGCDLLQGYYFSRPVSAEDFMTWYDEQQVAA